MDNIIPMYGIRSCLFSFESCCFWYQLQIHELCFKY